MNTRIASLTLALAVGLGGCIDHELDPLGTDSGNAMDVDLGMAAERRRAATASEISQAWMGINGVAPLPCGGGTVEDPQLGWADDLAVDLLEGADLGQTELPTDDTYCGLFVKVGRLEGQSSPLGERYAVVLEGVTTGGRAFEIRMPDEIELVLRDDGSTLTPREAVGAVVLHDLDAWIAGVDLDGLTPDGDGVVRIDEGDEGLLERLEQAIEGAARLAIDDDGDLAPDP